MKTNTKMTFNEAFVNFCKTFNSGPCPDMFTTDELHVSFLEALSMKQSKTKACIFVNENGMPAKIGEECIVNPALLIEFSIGGGMTIHNVGGALSDNTSNDIPINDHDFADVLRASYEL